MAPVTATTTGVARHPIDDANLETLISRLRSFDKRSNVTTTLQTNDLETDLDIEGLVGELERFTEWRFGELVRRDTSNIDSLIFILNV